MNILKTTGRFFAGAFILLGLTIFFMASFGNYAVKNFNVLENDLNSQTVKLLQDKGVDIEQLRTYCNQNPSDENCNLINENPMLDTIEKEINGFKYYGSMMRVFGVIFYLLGIFLFVLCSGWLIGLRQVSLVSFIGSLFSYLYYKYAITGALNSFLPKELLDIFGSWINISLNQALNLILILCVIFLILTIVLYVKTKKKKEVLEQGSKDESRR